MALTAITINFLETFDIPRYISAKVTFDHIILELFTDQIKF
jgi:hypothetical protein